MIKLGEGNRDLRSGGDIVSAVEEAGGCLGFEEYGGFRGFEFLKEGIGDLQRKELGMEVEGKKEIAVLSGGKRGVYVMSECVVDGGEIGVVGDGGQGEYD